MTTTTQIKYFGWLSDLNTFLDSHAVIYKDIKIVSNANGETSYFLIYEV